MRAWDEGHLKACAGCCGLALKGKASRRRGHKLRGERVVCCCVETEGSTPQAGRRSPGAWKPESEGQSGGRVRVWEGKDRGDQKVG